MSMPVARRIGPQAISLASARCSQIRWFFCLVSFLFPPPLYRDSVKGSDERAYPRLLAFHQGLEIIVPVLFIVSSAILALIRVPSDRTMAVNTAVATNIRAFV
ncbi:hypothetical protein F4823DRAFT_579907 [Ustulina deusta]|nr:hypothetical protein F4823DRAFT_579907 [Ustulina deusta]